MVGQSRSSCHSILPHKLETNVLLDSAAADDSRNSICFQFDHLLLQVPSGPCVLRILSRVAWSDLYGRTGCSLGKQPTELRRPG